MSRRTEEPNTFEIDPHRLYDLIAASAKIGLSVYHLRQKAVSERKIALIRYSPRGKVMFRGADLLEYLAACRQPAIGERARASARAANGLN